MEFRNFCRRHYGLRRRVFDDLAATEVTFTQRYTLCLFGFDTYMVPSLPLRRLPRQPGAFAG